MKKTDFSTTLQELRRERKITQEQLANYLGVSPQAVSKWENGSYPEGDLLPNIADYFNVSIDYLYRRGVKNKSFEQEIMEMYRAICQDALEKTKKDGQKPEFWEKLFKMIWAVQISPWMNNSSYYDRQVSVSKSAKTASIVMDDTGYSFMSLNKDKEFYFTMETPQGGYLDWIKDQTASRKLFSILSKEENVKVLTYLCTMGYGEYASSETISKATGIDIKVVNSLLDYLSNSLVGESGRHSVQTINLVNTDGKKENAYGIDMNLVGLLLALFAIADMFADPVTGYQMQISNRVNSWISREEL